MVLVDDQQLVRAGIAFILSTEPGISVASEAANGELGLVAVADHRPDVVLMDVRMPVLDGLAATRRIRDADGPPVLVLTTFDDDDVLWGAVEAGAAGFLLKDTSADDIIRAIRTVADGGSWIDPRVTPRLLRALRAGRPATSSTAVVDALSERELEVLTLVARVRRTVRSRPSCSSASAPSRATSGRSSPSSGLATGRPRSCWPSTPGSSCPVAVRRSCRSPRR